MTYKYIKVGNTKEKKTRKQWMNKQVYMGKGKKEIEGNNDLPRIWMKRKEYTDEWKEEKNGASEMKSNREEQWKEEARIEE